MHREDYSMLKNMSQLTNDVPIEIQIRLLFNLFLSKFEWIYM